MPIRKFKDFTSMLPSFQSKSLEKYCSSWQGHFSPISTQNGYSRTLCTRLRDYRLERISLLVSAITKSFAFFLMKVIYKSNSNFFFLYLHSKWYKHSWGLHNCLKFSQPSCVYICNNIPCLSRHLSRQDKVRDLC